MKCPLLTAAKWAVGEIVLDTESDCLQAECAWWDTTGGACAIKGIRHSLRTLCVEANTIAKELTLIRPK